MKPDIKTVVGRTAKADFPLDGIRGVDVKIDTGADTSSIWASEIYVDDDHRLHYVLFAKGSLYYSGKKHVTSVYTVVSVYSSTGHNQVRYRVSMPVKLQGRLVRGSFTLTDRSHSTYPVLIGCKLLNKKFIVDVSRGDMKYRIRRGEGLASKFKENPKAFYEQYHGSSNKESEA